MTREASRSSPSGTGTTSGSSDIASRACRLLAVAAGLAALAAALDAVGQPNWQPTALEIAQLPRFCWAQFKVPEATGDEFTMHDCGPAANHYCTGLVDLIRGKAAGTKRKSLPLIQHADVDVAYTERGIADYPKCSIREHVQATRSEIDYLLQIYGAKPARK